MIHKMLPHADTTVTSRHHYSVNETKHSSLTVSTLGGTVALVEGVLDAEAHRAVIAAAVGIAVL
jgi:hypothetical protein